MLVDLVNLIDNGSISSKQGKEVLEKVLDTGKEPKVIVEELGISQITSLDEIRKIVLEVIIIEAGPFDAIKYPIITTKKKPIPLPLASFVVLRSILAISGEKADPIKSKITSVDKLRRAAS